MINPVFNCDSPDEPSETDSPSDSDDDSDVDTDWITPPKGICKTDEDCIDPDSSEAFCCAKDVFSGEGKKKKYCMPAELNGLKLQEISSSPGKKFNLKCKTNKV